MSVKHNNMNNLPSYLKVPVGQETGKVVWLGSYGSGSLMRLRLGAVDILQI